MASTYTVNIGIEKPGTGDQSGTWGDTTNTNFDIIDQATNGIATVTLAAAGTSGSPNTLLINNGALSDGRNRFIEFNDGADLGATAYVQLGPNDAEKIVHLRNSLSSSRSLIVFQGNYSASNDFEIPNGADVLLKFNGGGTGATVTDVNANLTATKVTSGALDVDNINLDGNAITSTDTNGDVDILPNGSGKVNLDGDGSSGGVTISDGLVDIRTGTGTRSQVKFYCESGNDHAQTVQPQPHSAGVTNTLTLPAGGDQELVGTTDTQTLTNKTLTAPTITGAGQIAGVFTGDLTGNADTATALETARTIGGVSFNGTANINLPGVNTSGSQDTSGNAATATALATGRTIGMTGDVVWTSASFDGSGNVTGTATIQANSVALGTDTTGNYVGTITGGTGIDSTGATSGEGIAHTLSLDLNELTTSTSDGDGDFFAVVDSSGNQKKLTKGNINISGFNNNSGFITSANGGNAATLDSLDSTQFLRSDAADTKTSGDLTFSDNVKAKFGTGSDLLIYHDGTDSYVYDDGTGNLKLRTGGTAIELLDSVANSMAKFTSGGASEIYYDGSKKLETTNTGVTATGTVLSSDGQFGLDTTDYIQFVNNSHLRFIVNGGEEARLEADGDFHADGDIIAFSTTISDERLKTDIKKIDSALDKVGQLNGYTFTYKADSKKSAGVIAQEVEKVLPSAVSEKELPLKVDDGVAYKTVQYDQLVGLLIEAVNELQAKVAKLEGK